MSSQSCGHIPVVDVDQAFPALVGTSAGSTAGATHDLGPTVRAAIRDVLGVRSREEDAKAFTDALTAAFRLTWVEGHVESQFVPRGYAIQADLGAVTGGQASLYRRAMVSRTEILRILDGLTALRNDGDDEDMDAYRTIVRNAVQSLVDEIGAAGGPRVGMVDAYFTGLTGGDHGQSPDTIGGQLGALRDRFGLIDDNVNTIEEEGLRTAFWTLVDMVRDLKEAWDSQSLHFGGGDGAGFLGTELILLSRLMEAAADQTEELENILDSVLIPQSERQTIRLHDRSNLTLDGLISWLRAFLSDEGRRLAQDAGRDGIVSALTPTVLALAQTFKRFLADPIIPREPRAGRVPIQYLPVGCCQQWPAGMYSARVQIAVSSLCRLLMDLARTAQRIGRWAGVVVIDVTVSEVTGRVDDGRQSRAANVEFRGLNMRPSYIPAFVKEEVRAKGEGRCTAEQLTLDDLVLPMDLSATSDGESVSALFRIAPVQRVLGEAGVEFDRAGVLLPAADVPIAILDLETGAVVHAPWPTTWPRLTRADRPRDVGKGRHVPDPDDDDPDWKVADYRLHTRPRFDDDTIDGDGFPLSARSLDFDLDDDPDEVQAAAEGMASLGAALHGQSVFAQARYDALLENARLHRDAVARAEGRRGVLAAQIEAQDGKRNAAGVRKDQRDKIASEIRRLRRQMRDVDGELTDCNDKLAQTEAELAVAEKQVEALREALQKTDGVKRYVERRQSKVAAMNGRTTGEEH
ncbi:hypothetical protein [Nocardioides caricicola]|uniref:Uncharacterized protein n=1 Tax=Nocardioides caricicola TaxID=634770 RepID=A0ABW0MXX0_9ACTN